MAAPLMGDEGLRLQYPTRVVFEAITLGLEEDDRDRESKSVAASRICWAFARARSSRRRAGPLSAEKSDSMCAAEEMISHLGESVLRRALKHAPAHLCRVKVTSAVSYAERGGRASAPGSGRRRLMWRTPNP